MSLKRRQFLMLAGATTGFGLAACVRQLATSEPAPTSVAATSIPTTSPSAIASPSPVANDQLLAQGIPNPPRGDVRLVVISDINGPYGATTYSEEVNRAIALIPSWQPDLVIASGDMVAGQDRTLTRAKIQEMWAGFDRSIAAPLRQANLPLGFTLGNHDASRAAGVNGLIYRQERDLAAAYWNDPAHTPAVEFVDRYQFPFYYTFQKGEVFFLVWDATSGLPMPAENLAWVEKSLASDTAQAAKLRIVIGHLPLYAVAQERDKVGEVLDDADELRSLLERYNVHTYISGHHHAYYPAHRGRLEMLHAGAMGDGPRLLLAGELPRIKTLTVVDINLESVSTVYTTYDIETMQVLEQNELPRLIVGHNGVVFRRDINWSDLTPQEQASCIQKHSAALCQS
ncbi:MAG: metallophosphoesterase [Oculatellaceae cyanobacterium bins.114]|nr:metallophosphoesterase [Oculatellaceae cyanobacterium bins.114]